MVMRGIMCDIASESTDRIINSPARRSPVLEAVLNGAHRSYANLAPHSHPSTGRIGASLVVKSWRYRAHGLRQRRCGVARASRAECPLLDPERSFPSAVNQEPRPNRYETCTLKRGTRTFGSPAGLLQCIRRPRVTRTGEKTHLRNRKLIT